MEKVEVIEEVVTTDAETQSVYSELMPIAEIATALGLSERVVRHTLDKALSKMRKEFKKQGVYKYNEVF